MFLRSLNCWSIPSSCDHGFRDLLILHDISSVERQKVLIASQINMQLDPFASKLMIYVCPIDRDVILTLYCHMVAEEKVNVPDWHPKLKPIPRPLWTRFLPSPAGREDFFILHFVLRSKCWKFCTCI